MDELRCVSSEIFSAKKNVDINEPATVVIKAFIKGQDHSRRRFCELFRFWPTSVVSAHAPLFDESILALFRCETESDFSGFSGFAVIVPFTWTVKEQYVPMCLDAFAVCVFVPCQCLCRFLLTSESHFRFSVFVSSSSPFFQFQCFIGDIYLLDSCALSAACALYMIWVQFYFKTGGCDLCAAAAGRLKITVHHWVTTRDVHFVMSATLPFVNYIL